MKYRVIINATEEVEADSPMEAIEKVMPNLDDQDVTVQEWHNVTNQWETI